MNEEDKKELGEVDELKFDLLTDAQVQEEISDDAREIFLDVETFVGEVEQWPEELENTVVARTTFRGSRVFASDINYSKERQTVSFKVSTIVPEYFPENLEDKNIATTYMDFCWLLSDGTTALNKNEVETPYKEDCQLGDLNWMIPSKFSDDFVEMMQVMNDVVLNGELSQAVIYGPKYASN